MALLLWREENIIDVKRLRMLKAFHGHSTAVCNNMTYKVSESNSAEIEITPSGGKPTVKLASTSFDYPPVGKLSNGVVWKGEAIFFSDGVLWALNISKMSWRKVCQRHYKGKVIKERSNNDDLLRIVDDNKGTLLFSRFRPSFDDCQFVINYGIHMLPSDNTMMNGFDIKNPYTPDGIITIPAHIWHGINEDCRNGYRQENARQVPYTIAEHIQAIGEGKKPYPQTEEEAEEIWKQPSKEDAVEAIRQLRVRESSSLFSRQCPICYVVNPSERAAYVECGHLSCLACAKQLTLEALYTLCPTCQRKSAIVKIHEAEKEDDAMSKMKVEEN